MDEKRLDMVSYKHNPPKKLEKQTLTFNAVHITNLSCSVKNSLNGNFTPFRL